MACSKSVCKRRKDMDLKNMKKVCEDFGERLNKCCLL